MHREPDAEVGIVVQIGARGDDPVDEASFDQGNECGNAKPRRRQRACYRHADRDFRLQHALAEQLARLA